MVLTTKQWLSKSSRNCQVLKLKFSNVACWFILIFTGWVVRPVSSPPSLAAILEKGLL